MCVPLAVGLPKRVVAANSASWCIGLLSPAALANSITVAGESLTSEENSLSRVRSHDSRRLRSCVQERKCRRAEIRGFDAHAATLPARFECLMARPAMIDRSSSRCSARPGCAALTIRAISACALAVCPRHRCRASRARARRRLPTRRGCQRRQTPGRTARNVQDREMALLPACRRRRCRRRPIRSRGPAQTRHRATPPAGTARGINRPMRLERLKRGSIPASSSSYPSNRTAALRYRPSPTCPRAS